MRILQRVKGLFSSRAPFRLPLDGHLELVLALLDELRGLGIGQPRALLPAHTDELVVQPQAYPLGHAALANLATREVGG